MMVAAVAYLVLGMIGCGSRQTWDVFCAHRHVYPQLDLSRTWFVA